MKGDVKVCVEEGVHKESAEELAYKKYATEKGSIKAKSDDETGERSAKM